MTYEEAVLKYAEEYTGKKLEQAYIEYDDTFSPGCESCDWGAEYPGNYLVCVPENEEEYRYKIYDIADLLRELIKLSQEEVVVKNGR